jgi:hypothetical protein
MLLSLTVWIGGIIFFVALAPIPFAVLPSRHLAGEVIAPALTRLHWMGIVSGIVFLLTSLAWNLGASRAARPLAAKHLLVIAMLALTCISQFLISTRMSRLRAAMGTIDAVATGDTRRMEFDRLHVWSTRLEGAVLIMGLVTIFLVAGEATAARLSRYH